jgi:hypothetical protein
VAGTAESMVVPGERRALSSPPPSLIVSPPPQPWKLLRR